MAQILGPSGPCATPEIDSEDYIDALEQFAATAKLYPTDAMTPGKIWRAVRRGVLQGGIGYEVPDLADRSESDSRTGEQAGQQASVEDFEVSVFRCPLETEIDQVFFGPQTPLACLSSGCRQTDASKRMIGWLSGGERIAAVRQQSEPFSMVRRPPESETSQSGSAYSRCLAERLQTRQVARGLILPGASQYYTVLDREVLRCLAGEQSAKEPLTGAALQWQAITDKIGRETQQVAWKKTLGFGG